MLQNIAYLNLSVASSQHGASAPSTRRGALLLSPRTHSRAENLEGAWTQQGIYSLMAAYCVLASLNFSTTISTAKPKSRDRGMKEDGFITLLNAQQIKPQVPLHCHHKPNNGAGCLLGDTKSQICGFTQFGDHLRG